MGGKGLDFKHKEVVNITDGRRLRLRTRCGEKRTGYVIREKFVYEVVCKAEI